MRALYDPDRRMRRKRDPRRLAPQVLALTVILLVALPAGASAAPRIPRANIPWGTLPAACETSPAGSVCELAWLHYLDRARAHIGLKPYAVPQSFVRMPATHQLFALSNLDRIAYRLPLITGLVSQLDRAAAKGAAKLQDPLLPSGPFEPPWTSNFAAAPNALEGYYLWMYDDGYPGSNADCRRRNAPGCWGHRRDILAIGSRAPSGYKIAMGVAAGRSPFGGSFTTLLALARRSVRLAYSWSSAERLGVGRITYVPPS